MSTNNYLRTSYSRDKRGDCPQVVIALVVTPDGLPLTYEVMPGDTADSTTLKAFLHKIEQQYGKARRVWVMDRGVPTEEGLAQMRASDPPVQYLVGTPKGRPLARTPKALPPTNNEGLRNPRSAGQSVLQPVRETLVSREPRSRSRAARETTRNRPSETLQANLASFTHLSPPSSLKINIVLYKKVFDLSRQRSCLQTPRRSAGSLFADGRPWRGRGRPRRGPTRTRRFGDVHRRRCGPNPDGK
jgi:hypothetical protein